MVSLNVLTMCMYGYTHTDIYVHTHIYVMLEEKKFVLFLKKSLWKFMTFVINAFFFFFKLGSRECLGWKRSPICNDIFCQECVSV